LWWRWSWVATRASKKNHHKKWEMGPTHGWILGLTYPFPQIRIKLHNDKCISVVRWGMAHGDTVPYLLQLNCSLTDCRQRQNTLLTHFILLVPCFLLVLKVKVKSRLLKCKTNYCFLIAIFLSSSLLMWFAPGQVVFFHGVRSLTHAWYQDLCAI
jgi:hypothetical protein